MSDRYNISLVNGFNFFTNNFAISCCFFLLLFTNIGYSTEDILGSNDPTLIIEYKADINEGTIGLETGDLKDSPHDNIFLIDLEETRSADSEYTLEYDVFGVQGAEAVRRSVNQRLSVGGYLVKESDQWTSCREHLSASWLKNGTNVVQFHEIGLAYKIRNVRIIEKKSNEAINDIAVLNSSIEYEKNGMTYIRCVVPGNSKESQDRESMGGCVIRGI